MRVNLFLYIYDDEISDVTMARSRAMTTSTTGDDEVDHERSPRRPQSSFIQGCPTTTTIAAMKIGNDNDDDVDWLR